MKRICCFCETWESGGIESFLTNVLLHMDLSGLEVDVVAARIGESIFTERLQACGVVFRELSGNIRDLKGNFSSFSALLNERHYDVVHLNLYQGLSLYYCVVAQKAGVPMRIVHSHNTQLRKSGTRWLKMLLHAMGKQLFDGSATKRWACSRDAGKFLFPANSTFEVIPNGIATSVFRFDTERRRVMREDLGVSDAFVIGNIGRLSYQKNQWFLLDVLSEVLKVRPNSMLLLIGEGDKRAELEEKASCLRISEHVIFYGVTDKIPELLWAMDVFAFPSHLEGLGIVAIEAQAAGLPVICSEYIPEEAYATKLMQRQPLSTGAAGWANLLCDIKPNQRGGMDEAVKAAGFEIGSVAKRVKDEWME